MPLIRAVVVYLSADLLSGAYAWCAAHGYTVAYTVPKDRFEQAAALAYAQKLVIVAASADSVDPERLPRLEVVPGPN